MFLFEVHMFIEKINNILNSLYAEDAELYDKVAHNTNAILDKSDLESSYYYALDQSLNIFYEDGKDITDDLFMAIMDEGADLRERF
jgi:hypothetical protein